jgi:ArsR family transcriptional regulator
LIIPYSLIKTLTLLRLPQHNTRQANEMELSTTPPIQEKELTRSTEILRALAHPLRMQILEFIDQNEMINVNKIYSSLRLEQSITSQHLRILRQAGLVETERRGKFIHYRLKYGKLKHTMAAILAYEKAIQPQKKAGGFTNG